MGSDALPGDVDGAMRGCVLPSTKVELAMGKSSVSADRKLAAMPLVNTNGGHATQSGSAKHTTFSNGGNHRDGMGRMRPGAWHFVSVSVAADAAGTMDVFVDGHRSNTIMGLRPEDLRLRHKLIVLGGGKQAQAKGGDVRRVLLASGSLAGSALNRLYCDTVDDNTAVGGCAVRIQALARGARVRNLARDEKIAMGIESEQEQEAKAKEEKESKVKKKKKKNERKRS
jgi:hypothetical protein